MLLYTKGCGAAKLLSFQVQRHQKRLRPEATTSSLLDGRSLQPIRKRFSYSSDIWSRPTALLVQEYVMNYRGKQDHSFLISSRNRRPLSTERITEIFQKVTASLPKHLQKLLADMTTKSPSVLIISAILVQLVRLN
jgi:hypothetical protein